MSPIPKIFDKNLELIAEDTDVADANEGNGASVKVGAGMVFKAVLKITDKSGTSPTLDVHIEESADDSSFTDIEGAAFTQKEVAGEWFIVFETTKKYVRCVTDVGGTAVPTFTDCHLYLCPASA